MNTRLSNFCQEVWLQVKILFQDGRSELKLYRLERNQTVLWVPSKGNWVRARLVFRGQRYDRIQFVDGKRAKGKRSPLSCRPRDPRKRGADKPDVDARYSGNRPVPWPKRLSDLYDGFRELTHCDLATDDMATALKTLEGG